VSVSTQRRLSLEFALLPNQLIISVKHNEVVDVRRRDEVLLSSGSRIDAPSSEKDNIWTTDVGSMTISRQRRCTRYSHSCPLVFFSIQNSYIVQVARLQLSTLSKICTFLQIVIECKASLHDHVSSYLQSSMTLSFGWYRTLTFWLCPSHDLEIEHKEIIEILFAIGAAKDKYFCLAD